MSIFMFMPYAVVALVSAGQELNQIQNDHREKLMDHLRLVH